MVLTAFIIFCHLLGTITALHAIVKVRTSQGAIAWALSLALFPYLVLPLYWIFGRNRFHGYVEALRHNQIVMLDPASGNTIPAIITHYQTIFPSKQNDFQVLANINQIPCTKDNALQLLIDGEMAFDSMFQAISIAERYILIQFFIIRDDELGQKLQNLLIAKAAAGVRVYMLYDEIGSRTLSHSYIQRLSVNGVIIEPFNTTRGIYNRFQLNFRNHRKIVIADGRVAFLGGLNVGDEYLGLGKLGHWRDTHLRIEGPAVQALQHTFAADWYWAKRSILVLEWNPVSAGQNNILIYPTGPADDLEKCAMFFHQAIASAERRLWIASPYFVPSLQVFEVLQLAALRGVDVRILLPAKPDHLLVYLASFSFLKAADRVGIKIYRYQQGFLHQKVVLIDDDIACVGTANLDNRSMRLNFEVTAIVPDSAFAKEVEAMLEDDFQKSIQTSAADLERRSWGFKWAVRAARLFDPIL